MRAKCCRLNHELVLSLRGVKVNNSTVCRSWNRWLDEVDTVFESGSFQEGDIATSDQLLILQSSYKLGLLTYELFGDSDEKRRISTACRMARAFAETGLQGNTFAHVLKAWKQALLKRDFEEREPVVIERNALNYQLQLLYGRTLWLEYHHGGVMISTFSRFYQLLCYAERLKVDSVSESVSENYNKYVAQEAELVKNPIQYKDPQVADTIAQMAEVLQEWFPLKSGFLKGFEGRFGPGTTQGVEGRPGEFLKYLTAKFPEALRNTLVRSNTQLHPFISDFSTEKIQNYVQECSVVPKNALVKRTIGKEQSGLMWAQQAIAEILVKTGNTTDWSRHINLNDQSASSKAALQASADGVFATLDFSSASDYITVDLVKAVFPKWLSNLLIEARSTTVSFEWNDHGKIVKHTLPIRKYAAMGSALCFPVESTIFACCCEVAARRSGGNSDFLVYGDDTILECKYVENFKRICRDLHFKLNEDKSYSEETHSLLFREACGMEAVNGFDITPLRLSRRADAMPLVWGNPKSLSRVIAEANQATEHGFMILRQFYMNYLRKSRARIETRLGSVVEKERVLQFIPPREFNGDDGPGLYSFKPGTRWLGSTRNDYGAVYYQGLSTKQDKSYDNGLSLMLRRCYAAVSIPFMELEDRFNRFGLDMFFLNERPNPFILNSGKWNESLNWEKKAQQSSSPVKHRIDTMFPILKTVNYAPPDVEYLTLTSHLL